jgi:hypothetical protein
MRLLHLSLAKPIHACMRSCIMLLHGVIMDAAIVQEAPIQDYKRIIGFTKIGLRWCIELLGIGGSTGTVPRRNPCLTAQCTRV